MLDAIRYLVDNGIKWQVLESRDRDVTFLGAAWPGRCGMCQVR